MADLHRLAFALALALSACAPRTFVRTQESTWATVEIRPDIEREQAWETLVDTLVKRFDLEVLSKPDGYVRTSWLYTWTGQVDEKYRVRVTAKFSPDRKKVEVKSEAEHLFFGGWNMGYDTRLLETIKTDIMGSLGRTAR